MNVFGDFVNVNFASATTGFINGSRLIGSDTDMRSNKLVKSAGVAFAISSSTPLDFIDSLSSFVKVLTVEVCVEMRNSKVFARTTVQWHVSG